MIRVTITVEQDENAHVEKDAGGYYAPLTATYSRVDYEGLKRNPAYVGDAMQTLVLLTARDAIRDIGRVVKYRDHEDAIHAGEDLIASIEIGGNGS